MNKIFQIAVALALAWIVLQYLPQPNPIHPPGPVDPVDPHDPTPPEPTFAGYDVKVYDSVMRVKSRSRRDECLQLSADVQSIYRRIDNAEITTNPAVVDALVVAFKKLPPSWYGQIRRIADEVLQPLTKDGSLNSPARWSRLLKVADKGIMRAAEESTGVGEEKALDKS